MPSSGTSVYAVVRKTVNVVSDDGRDDRMGVGEPSTVEREGIRSDDRRGGTRERSVLREREVGQGGWSTVRATLSRGGGGGGVTKSGDGVGRRKRRGEREAGGERGGMIERRRERGGSRRGRVGGQRA